MTYLKTIHNKLISGIGLTGNETLVMVILTLVIVFVIAWATVSIFEAWNRTVNLKHFIKSNDRHADDIMNGR